MSERWYVVRTKSNKEMVARVNFEQQGYRVYLPMFQKTIRHSRKVKEVYRPIFPGYLFLLLKPEDMNWIAIGSTRGAVGPLRFGEQYVPVPDWVMERIREREDQPGIISLGRLVGDKLRKGVKVEFELPNNTYAEGTIFSRDGQCNVIVLLDILKREVKLSVPVEHLRLHTAPNC